MTASQVALAGASAVVRGFAAGDLSGLLIACAFGAVWHAIGRVLERDHAGRFALLAGIALIVETVIVGVLGGDGATVVAPLVTIGAATIVATAIAGSGRALPTVLVTLVGTSFTASALIATRADGVIATGPMVAGIVGATLLAIAVDVARVRAFQSFGTTHDLARHGALDADVHAGMEKLVTLGRSRHAQRDRDARDLAEARRAQGRIYAGISHELKSPLNAVLGFADLATSLDPTPSQKESLDVIARKARSLVALVETLLDVARVETREVTLKLRPLSIATLLDDVVVRARELSEARAAVRVELLSQPTIIQVDATYLPRALALFAAHAAELREGAEQKQPVRLAALVDGGMFRVTIEHSDRELSPEGLTRLLAGTSTRDGTGLTLGLRGAKAILELHGGTVSAAFSSSGVAVLRCEIPVGDGDTSPAPHA
jgi:signal transduction histidine kinase